MQRILLLDADGVALRNKGYYSERFSKEYDIPLEKITPFFKKEFRLCQIGAADLKEELTKYFPEWGWSRSAEEFIAEWFSSDIELDEEVFKEVARLQTSGTKCYLATDQEKYRADYLLKEKKMSTLLNGCFFSYELGVSKEDPAYFLTVIKRLRIAPADIIYFDDDRKNLDAARSVGVMAEFYEGIKQLQKMS